MFAVKGIYDGKSIAIDDPVPVAEKYAVAITFLYPIEKQQSENVKENIESSEKIITIIALLNT